MSATALLALSAAPALADNSDNAARQRAQLAGFVLGDFDDQLSRREREAYPAIFAAIRDRNWQIAQERLAAAPRGLLHPVARAELYLAAGSPRVEMEDLAALLREAPELPEASSIARLAESRGLEQTPHLPAAQRLRRLPGPSRRSTARPVSDDSAARSLARQVHQLIVDDSPRQAEDLLNGQRENLSPSGLTEIEQRIAWSYYLTGDDRNARRLARQARQGQGDWTVHADWVDGLAAWRQRDFDAAAEAFTAVSRRAPESELRSAGLYWAARAEMAAGRPQNVQAHLRGAAYASETFYGLLAAQTLGLEASGGQGGPAPSSGNIEQDRNAQRAVALAAIGETRLAESYVRHGAALSRANNHDAWVELAEQLDLSDAHLWLSQNAPVNYHQTTRTRFPAPAYNPRGGWRVDRSLVYAHALQESNFRPDAVSPAGARGLMQLMPGTARLLERQNGSSILNGDLNNPEANIAYGQAYMLDMRDFPGTQALLPKVIASYNAGPGAVVNWEGRLRDRGDPLLYIESIPFYETRGYVPIVLRNYWMYQRNAGDETTSLAALAQGMWPRFPGTPGPVAVRLSGHGGARIAD
ncbi:MAG: transglycosylase SLT domain-containing protein [Sphingomonadaceae bacterium]|nr:transglycosylase SLT domain-containing protein [Sphingomonadaceae bacterium]